MAMPDKLARVLWLAGPLALVVAPHLLRLPYWIGLVWLVCLLARLQQARRDARPLGRGPRYALAIAGLAGVFLQFGSIFGPQGGVALLVVLSGLKLLETAGERDHVILVFLGYFLLLANFLDSQGLILAAYLLAVAVLLTASLVAIQSAAPRPVAGILGSAAVLLLQALPLAALLFFVFPRLPTPIGGLLQTQAARTGLSESMQPGSISQLIQSDAVAFRVDFADPKMDGRRLYWRGPVLWDYDGRTWNPARDLAQAAPLTEGLGRRVDYSVTLEPHGQRWLLVAGLAETPPMADASLTGDLQWLARNPVSERRRYAVSAWLDYRIEPTLAPDLEARALTVPAHLNPRAQALARQWAAATPAKADLVNRALRHFRQEQFFYTLNPPLLGEHAVDDFLFETRRGFCEHYANAFVVLMRLAGVPARVVTGYQGGELNPLGGYWIVRQRDAHAWAEVWLAGRGWVQVDPTAAVAPSRIEQGVTAALPASERPVAVMELAWLKPLRQGWDLVNARWNQWVLGYDHARQRDLLQRLHPALATLQGLLWTLVAGGAALLLLLLAVVFLPRRQPPADPAARHYARFCARLARLGIIRAPSEGPADFARRVAALRPDLAEEVAAITRLYIGQRYGASAGSGPADLAAQVARFRPAAVAARG
jgi:transglutaminase-like putative cysteine protease